MRTGTLSRAIFCASIVFLASLSLPSLPAWSQVGQIENGNMESATSNDGKLNGWTSYLWEGSGSISRSADVAFSGKHSALIENVGPSKQAIFQRLQLSACSYRLTAAIASYGLEAGSWQQTTSLVVIFADRSSETRTLIKGDTDWRTIELIFNVPVQQEVIIYFFNYGSGRFFVDDVDLTTIADCTKKQSTFILAEQSAKKLVFEPPLGPEDYVMAGYCSKPGFADREFCKRIAKRPPEDERIRGHQVLISDFANVNPFEAGALIEHNERSGGKFARLRPGQFLAASTDLGLLVNWEGYDKLRVEVENPSNEPQPLTISVWDDKTTGYWSRVNWYVFAPAGASTVDMPLQIFVGEKSVVQERRRLDLRNIRRLVFLETKVELRLSNLRLEMEPPVTASFPELIALDLGTPTSPVAKGFSPMHASLTYRPWRGYGLSPGTVVARAEDRRHPDNLHRDWISFRSGGLLFDLPNGRYRIWMTLEDPGYWEYYPSWRSRTIYIQNKEALVEKPTFNEFLIRYFRHANDEDFSGDDIWERYISPRYAPRAFDAVVTDGQLSIRFDGHNDPFATALSALVIYPAEQDEQGQAFLRERRQALKAQFNAEYRQIVPMPAAKQLAVPNALDGSLWLFERSSATEILSTDTPNPEELRESFAVSLAKGEIEALTLALRPQKSGLKITGLTVHISGLHVTPYKIRNKATRLTFDGSVYMNKPRLLDPLSPDREHPLILPPDRTTGLWFDVEVAEGTPPGVRTGSIAIQFEDGRTMLLPVKATVFPWKLPPADVPIGYLGSTMTYPVTSYPELTARRQREFSQSLDILKRFGMTAVSGGLGPIHFSHYKDNTPLIDFAAADESMAAFSSRFGGNVAAYSGLSIEGIAVDSVEDTQERHRRPYSTVLRDILDSIERHGKRKSWLPLIHIIGDEPTGAAIANSIAVAKLFKHTNLNSKTGVFTSFTETSDPRAALAGAVNNIFINQHSASSLEHIKTQGSSCTFYNRDTRYDRGVYLYKARRLGCFGHLQFAFNSVHADPWYGLDGREDEYAAVLSHPDGKLRITLDFVRYRQAVSDYRYLRALERAIDAASDSAEKRQALAFLSSIEELIQIGSDKPKAFTSDELDRIRNRVQDHLLTLGYTGHAE
jgi:hypothetical protein